MDWDDVYKVAPFGAGQNDPRGFAVDTQARSPNYSGPGARSAINAGGTWGPFPEMTSGMTYREIGSSGLRAFSGWVREEFLPELVGRQGARVYREMADNNAIIGGILLSILATMRKVEWRVLPQEDGPEDQETIDFVQSLMDDMTESWEDHVVESLSSLQYGFAFHEIVYKRRLGRDPGPDPDRPGHDLPKSRYDDGKVGWRRLPLRGQDTVIKWFFDENGITKGVTQQPWIGPLIDIPIEKGLLFRPTQIKNNPEGRSILRSAYRSYFMTKRVEEQEAIMYERFNGFPCVYVPMELIEASNAGNPQAMASFANFKKIAVNVRVDEQAGGVFPSNTYRNADGTPSAVRMYDIEFKGPTGRPIGTASTAILDRYSVNMMTSVLADFLHLGHSARGTQALADNKVDMFFQAVEGYLNTNAAVYNRHALPRIFELNGMDVEKMPEIKPDLAMRIDLDVLSNFVLRLSQSGMPMFPNEDLQSYLLDAAGMPDVTEPSAMEFAGMTPELIDAKTDQKLNPPQPMIGGPGAKPGLPPPKSNGGSNLDKIIKASLARRIIRHGGPKFGVHMNKRKRRNPTRAERIAQYTNGHA